MKRAHDLSLTQVNNYLASYIEYLNVKIKNNEMKILITYALEAEKGNIQIPGCSVVFCCTGIGKVSTAIDTYEALLKNMPDLVLNVGTAGTFRHQVGDIVVCSRFFDRDLEKISNLGVHFRIDLTDELHHAGLLKHIKAEGLVSTGDTFQTDHDESGIPADVYDMESFAAAQVCKRLNVPYMSVKYVTDIIGRNSIKHWEEKLQDGRDGLAEFLMNIRF